MTDTSCLEGLDGTRAPLRYRWDASRKALYFTRRLGLAGRPGRGHLVAAVRFGPDGSPTMTWRPVPLSLVPALLGFGLRGLAYLAVLDDPRALIGVLPLFAFGVVFHGSQTLDAVWTRDGQLLPLLAKGIGERLEG